MKKLHLLLLGLTICLFSACHNDIWDAIDGLDSRVTKLEELCKEMNTNITSLQTIVDVLQSNDFITGVVEIKKDGEVIGYTITFGKHDPITIYHGQNGKDGQNGQDGQNGADGKDGSTPVIGVAQDTDGVYYWTLNGEWLLDDKGNKLPVSGKDGQNGTNGSNGQDGTDGKDGQDGEDGKDGADGQDGKDGITPQLKIEDGYWYISYDNGATWTQLGKATGEDGKDGADGKDGQNGADGKDGQDGDSMFLSVTQDENYVYFTLADGTIIKISKGNGSDDQPNENDIIEFKDLAVKSALLKLGIDTTKDNEISYGEAAMYKNPLKLENNTAIYSFKEFAYFTGVKTIGDYAFRGCSNLFEIILPENITSIGTGSFAGCSSLTSINIPESVTSIGESAFNECSLLEIVNIHNNITSIGRSAFTECAKLTSFTFPEKLISHVLHLFTPEYLKTVYWNIIKHEDELEETGTYTDLAGIGHTYHSSKYPQDNPNISITEVIFGDKVQNIPGYMCYNLDGLTEIAIPNSVTEIGVFAFGYCSSLANVSIGKNVTKIDRFAFYYCPIDTIILPKSTTEIGYNAFYSVSKVYCEAINPPILDGDPFNTNVTIYVPRNSVEDYRIVWSTYASRIVGFDF